ncbi:MAG UNVERIFIED_CONTAM: hypothetical protein LVQ98_07995 [Rickettsiaceae bacterium]
MSPILYYIASIARVIEALILFNKNTHMPELSRISYIVNIVITMFLL